MGKKSTKNNIFKICTYWAICICVIIILFSILIMAFKISSLNDEINLMPHYECTDKNIKEILHISPAVVNGITTNKHEVNLGYIRMSNSKITCEDDVGIYVNFGLLVNWGREEAICFIEETQRVCKLDKYILLGDDE